MKVMTKIFVHDKVSVRHVLITIFKLILVKIKRKEQLHQINLYHILLANYQLNQLVLLLIEQESELSTVRHVRPFF